MNYTTYGYIPSPQDNRDYNINLYTSFNMHEHDIPKEFIIPKLPPIMDQGNTGMCNAFSIAKIQTVAEWLEHGECEVLSPASIYVHKMFTDREGMCPRYALDALNKYGLTTIEELDTIGTYKECVNQYNKLNINVKLRAKKRKCKSYIRFNNIQEIQKFILKNLTPVLVGIDLYPSFYKCEHRNGIVNDIKNFEKKLGGHAMIIVGWKEINHKYYWIVQNHWTNKWGDNGYCYIPFNYKGIVETWGITDLKPNNTEIVLMTKEQLLLVNDELQDNFKFKNIDGTIYLPLRDIGNMFNMDVQWDNKNKIAILKGCDSK